MANSVAENSTSEVPGLVIVTHGRWGEELLTSAKMIAGEMEHVVAVTLAAGEEPVDYGKRIAQVLETLPKGSVVFADLLGGTPCNCSAALSNEYSISIVSGVNLPMLLEALCLRQSCSGEELVQALVGSGREGIQNVLSVLSRAV